MTYKTFWSDPYLTTMQARVVAVDGPVVVLESSIFFPFSGGQESDHGTIGGYPVAEARKRDHDIDYLLPEGHGLLSNQIVAVCIDWERRYRLMRLHFAAELVLELVNQTLGPLEKIGAHISPQKARLDFRSPVSLAPRLTELAAAAKSMIEQDCPITSAFSDEERERRYWEIAGFARVACGGTHPVSTGEVGNIRLRRNNIGQGKERIEIYLEDEHIMCKCK